MLQSSALGPGPGGVTITAQRAITISGQDSNGQPSQVVSLTGGAGSASHVVISASTLVLDGGRLSTGTLGAGRAGDMQVQVGQLTMSNGAQIDTSSVAAGAGGRIMLTARDAITITGQDSHGFPSRVTSFAVGDGAAGHLVISVPTLSVDGGAFSTRAFGAGRAGDMQMQVGRLTLSNGAIIDSGTSGTGAGGEITVTARDAVTITGQDRTGVPSQISSLANGDGASGRLVITAPVLLMDGGLLSTSTLAAGRAGDIQVQVGRLTLNNGAAIDSGTLGTGAGGGVTITAQEAVTIVGQRPDSSRSTIVSSTSSGNAGSLSISSPTLTMEGGRIAAGTLGAGRGGDIQVQVGQLTLTNRAAIDGSTFGPGQGGMVTVTARDAISISGQSSIASVSGVPGVAGNYGDAGTLVISAPSLAIDGTGGIAATTFGGGRAGDLEVQVGRLTLTNGATIDSSTLGSGHGGMVTITATEAISIAGQSIPGLVTSISSSAAGSGDAGSVVIAAPTIGLEGGGIFARTLGTGRAGDIQMQAGRLTLSNGAIIDSSTAGSGHGGTVMVTARDAIAITGQLTFGLLSGMTSLALGDGDAGTIIIKSPSLTMDGGIIAASTSGAGRAGDIQVEVGQLSLTNVAFIDSGTTGSGHGGEVTITAADTIFITGRGTLTTVFPIAGRDVTGTVESGVFSRTLGSGEGGTITVKAPRLTMQDGGRIGTETGGDGPAGDVRVQEVGHLALASGAQITSDSGFTIGNTPFVGTGAGGKVIVTVTDTAVITGSGSGLSARTVGQGQGGDVTLQARQIELTDRATVTAESSGAGKAGNVTLRAQETVRNVGGTVTTSTQSSGDAGVVSVVAPTVEVADGRMSAVTSGTGKAGDVVVEAERVTLTGRAQIDSSSSGAGQGGRVTIVARDAMTLSDLSGVLSNAASQGAAGTVTITTPTLQMDGPVAVEARTTGAGDAGNVEVHVERLTLTGGARIGSTSGIVDATGMVVAGAGRGGQVAVTASESLMLSGRSSTGDESGLFSQTFGTGDAGQVTVMTPRLTLADGGRISAATGGDGHGGDVSVQVESLSLTRESQITSSSGITVGGTLLVGAGPGGTVTVTATAPVTLSGPDSGLFTRTVGSGQGGDMRVTGARVTLTDGATISAESTGAGNAGNITILTQDSFLSTNGSVVTRATQADGGNIQITAPFMVRLRDSAITAEVGGGAQTVGGNITIDPQFVLLQNSQIRANAFAGRGGNIRIQAQQVFLADPASTVSASSALGISGQVNIQAPVTSISGTIAPLPQSFARAAELLRDRCAERVREGTVSRFVLGGRDGVPLEPGSLLLSPPAHIGPQSPAQSAPAQHERRTDSVGVWRSANVGQAQVKGQYAQALWPAALDVECARWMGR